MFYLLQILINFMILAQVLGSVMSVSQDWQFYQNTFVQYKLIPLTFQIDYRSLAQNRRIA